jgi:GNAT superfamily N-acetyltransferase
VSIEIDVVNGAASWPLAEPLFSAVYPPHVVAALPWAGVTFAHPELRVLIQDEAGNLMSHVGIVRRDVIWNGRTMRAGGIGGVATREDWRGRGYASMALDAAVHTLTDEGSIDFALLFCEPSLAPFYAARGWRPFEGVVYAEQPELGRAPFTATAPHILKIRQAPLKGTIDLCGLPW